jgi:hypothetical protein
MKQNGSQDKPGEGCFVSEPLLYGRVWQDASFQNPTRT